MFISSCITTSVDLIYYTMDFATPKNYQTQIREENNIAEQQ